ncbi:MAG: RNA pseudouridine synthase, partial [Candidatus Binatia bacterium]
DDRRTLLLVQPVTGRRHQIRIHLAWIGHPIEGDPLFDKSSAIRGARVCLHSWRLAFDACWLGGKRIEIEAPPGADFWSVVRDDLPAQDIPRLLQKARDGALRRQGQ